MTSKISRCRQFAFFVLVLSFSYFLTEVASLVIHRLYLGRAYSWAAAAAQRQAASAPLGVGKTLDRPRHRIHPYVGYVLAGTAQEDDPEFEKRFLWQEEVLESPTDGFISRRKILQKRSEKTVIIGIFGGSTAAGYYRKGIHHTIRHLRAHPRFREMDFVIVNLAMGGYKQPQQLMALAYILAQQGHLDLAINIDGFNEVALHTAENANHGTPPIYPRSWHFRVARLPQTLRLIGRVTLLEERIQRRARAFSRFPFSHSPTAFLLWRASSRRLERERADYLRKSADSGPPPGNPPGSMQSPAELYAQLAQIWQSSSLQMHHLCQANGIRYYHFLQPNQYVKGSKVLGNRERRVAFRDDHPYRPGVENGYPLLREAGEELRKSGVVFRDLTGIFLGEDEPVYIDDCCHFGELGHEIMARHVSDAILEEVVRN